MLQILVTSMNKAKKNCGFPTKGESSFMVNHQRTRYKFAKFDETSPSSQKS